MMNRFNSVIMSDLQAYTMFHLISHHLGGCRAQTVHMTISFIHFEAHTESLTLSLVALNCIVIVMCVCVCVLNVLFQTKAVGSERESSLCPAWRAVCGEGDSPAGGGWEAAAGGRASPTHWSARSGNKRQLVPTFFFADAVYSVFSGCLLELLYDALLPSRLRAVTQSSHCCLTSCSLRMQLSGTLWPRWEAWMRAWSKTKLTWTPTYSRLAHLSTTRVQEPADMIYLSPSTSFLHVLLSWCSGL